MKSPWKRLSICAAILLGIAAVFLLTPIGRILVALLTAERNAPFDKPYLQAIVEEVKAHGIKPGDHVEFRLDIVSDPKSLRPLKKDERIERGRGAGNVRASREPGGELIVIIESKDLGHAGEFGYAYSEVAPHKLDDNVLGFDEDVNLSCTEPSWNIAENWWRVATCYMD